MKGYIRSKNSLLWGFVALAAGILIANNSAQVIDFSIRILGALMLVLAGVELITVLTSKKHSQQKGLAKGFTIFGATITIIAGLFIIIEPTYLEVTFMYILAAFVLLMGVWQLNILYRLKKVGATFANSLFIFPSLLSVSGIIMLFFPTSSSYWIVTFAGYWIAASGLFEIITTIFIKTPKVESQDLLEENSEN